MISAEVRWFWPRHAPAGLGHWFRTATRDWCAAGGGATRTDRYLVAPGQTALGIKARGGRAGVEIKGLVTVLGGRGAPPPFAAPIELWCKWSTPTLPLRRTVAVDKQRWVRRFDTARGAPRELALDADEQPRDGQWPARGCGVELTRIAVAGERWWSLGFEAFGDLETVAADLRAVARVMARRRPPSLAGGRLLSYPAWLDERRDTQRAR